MRWFKSNRQRTAEKAVEVVDQALRQLDPERFIDPLDRALVTQPRLAMLNKLLGREGEKAFEPVSFEEVASLTRSYADGGMMLPLVKIINADPVLLGLFCAAMHENELRGEMQALYEKRLGQEVRRGAEKLVGMLNASARSRPSSEHNRET